jgi:putative transposase
MSHRAWRDGSHMSNNLVAPANIMILPPPPKSAELNAVENLWLSMRENWLSNRIFKSSDDVAANCCCNAWRKRESQPWRTVSKRTSKMGKWVLISEERDKPEKILLLKPINAGGFPVKHSCCCRQWIMDR